MAARRAASAKSGAGPGRRRAPAHPWFAIGFLALAVVNSLNMLPADVVGAAAQLDVFALTMAMTALGIETASARSAEAGPRVLALGFILYLWLILRRLRALVKLLG